MLALWGSVAWRTPASVRDPGQRPLWTAFLIWALGMTTALPGAQTALRTVSGSPSAPDVLRHLLSVFGCSAINTFIRHTTTGSPAPRPLRRRLAGPCTIATALLCLYVPLGRLPTANEALVHDTGDVRVLAYFLVWLGYTGYTLARTAWMLHRWSRTCRAGLLRRSLRCCCLGFASGAAFAFHRCLALVYLYARHRIPDPAVHVLVTHVLLVTGLLLVVAGVALPNLRAPAEAVRCRVGLLRIRRLWRALTTAAPSVVLHRSHEYARRGLLDPGAARSTLYRRVMEIRDALLILSDRAGPALRAEAVRHVRHRGVTEARATIAAEGCWLAAAWRGMLSIPSDRAGPVAVAAAGAGAGDDSLDLGREVAALRRLSTAFFSTTARTFTDAVAARPALEDR